MPYWGLPVGPVVWLDDGRIWVFGEDELIPLVIGIAVDIKINKVLIGGHPYCNAIKRNRPTVRIIDGPIIRAAIIYVREILTDFIFWTLENSNKKYLNLRN